MRKIYLPSLMRMVAWRRRIVALLRVFCGFLCAADACYRWLAIQSPLLLAGHGSSSPAVGWFASGLHLTHAFTLWAASTETLIACCLLCGALTNLACILGIFLALLGCTTTGALAAFLEPGSFDLGILLVAVLTFLGLSLANAGQTYGIDGLLARKLSLSTLVVPRSLVEPEVQAAHVASAPKKRQRVLFM